MKLIVGLGNPGREHRETRHNVGFMVVEEIARRYALGWTQAPSQVPDAFIAKRYGTDPLMLAKPLTYMNLSGDAVAGAGAVLRCGARRHADRCGRGRVAFREAAGAGARVGRRA